MNGEKYITPAEFDRRLRIVTRNELSRKARIDDGYTTAAAIPYFAIAIIAIFISFGGEELFNIIWPKAEPEPEPDTPLEDDTATSE